MRPELINYSIIIPYKDRPLLLNRALDSIPNREDIQVIVINNNSYPFSEACRINSSKSRLLILNQPDGGPGGARNEGMKYAEGRYTVFCDADDYFTEGAFDAFDKCIGNGYDIVFFRMDSIDMSTGKRGTRHQCYDKLVSLFFDTGDDSALRFKWGSAWGKLYRTAMLDRNKLRFGETKENGCGEDIIFSAKAGFCAASVTACDECVYTISSGGEVPSLTERYTWNDWINEYAEYEKKRDFLNSIGHPELADSKLKIMVTILRKGLKQRIRLRKFRLWSFVHNSKAYKALQSVKYKFDKIYFEVHLADHCNLNCACCSHFSPLAESRFCNLDSFRKDMTRMRELFPGSQVRRIRLLGGEPLLNPELCSFLSCTYELFPEAERQIVTNGILLTQQKEEFWDIVKSTNTTIFVSQYPIGLNYAALESMMKKKEVRYLLDKDGIAYFRKDSLNDEITKNPCGNWLHCNIAIRCSQLRDGKLYMCCKPAYIDILNKAFSKNFILDEKDYVDIYRSDARKAIRRYLTRPIPFCRYCETKQVISVPWHRSERKTDEWQ